MQIEYLKAENRILRSKLPKRITVTTAERARLVKLGVRPRIRSPFSSNSGTRFFVPGSV